MKKYEFYPGLVPEGTYPNGMSPPGDPRKFKLIY